MTPVRLVRIPLVVLFSTWALLGGASAARGQLSDVPRVLSSTDGAISGAAQIGRTLFVGGRFSQVGVASRPLVLVDGAGTVDPAALPVVNDRIVRAVSDGRGGALIIGDFTRIGDVPIERIAHILPDGSLDRAFRVSTDGAFSDVAVAHGRIYLVGAFTRINGQARRGFAALDAGTGQLLSWATSVTPGNAYYFGLAYSSTAVYVSGGGRLWGIDAGSGAVRFRRSLFVGALAATSQRVFVFMGAPKRVVGLDPTTGEEDGWTLPFGFRPVHDPYSSDGTYITHLVVDGSRLFMAGYFDPDDNGFDNLAVLDTATGARLPWPGVNGQYIYGFAIVGDVVVLSLQYGNRPELRDRVTGQILPFAAPVAGQAQSVVPIARGILLAGTFSLGGGTARPSMAAFDLDTGALTPWRPQDLGSSLFSFGVQGVATDGTWLFATNNATGPLEVHKIDPATGESVAIAAAPQPASGGSFVVAGDRLLMSANTIPNQWVVWALDVPSWTFVPSGVTVNGPVLGLTAVGDRVYLHGQFTTVNGVARRGVAAVDRASGALLPWNPAPDAQVSALAADATRVWVAGDFQAIGGQRRRGLAELDATTAQATAWNPDAPAGFRATGGYQSIGRLVRAADGTLIAFVTGYPATIGGQLVAQVAAFATDGRRLPFSSAALGYLPFDMAVTADCLVPVTAPDVRCHVPGIARPSSLSVSQSGAAVTLSWAPAASQTVAGWRLEVGRSEGRSDVAVLDLPASQTSIAAPVPPGGYTARVRAITPVGMSMATADVSFAVGQPAAPLDVSAAIDGRTVTLRWTPPTTGAPDAYVLEAGTAQGAAGLGLVLPGAATSHAVDVPPGEYWGRLYAVTNGVRSEPSREVRIDVDATQPSTCTTPAPAPVNVRAQVSAGQVVLGWDLLPGALLPYNWVVTAGSTPGAWDIGSFSLPGNLLGIAAAVPRGTYYVRVQALLLGCGLGTASADLRVDVP